MPELPEVEITRRGIEPRVVARRVARVVARERRLRWPVSARLLRELPGARIEAVERRAKYLLVRTDRGALIAHLGMSGSLRIVPFDAAPNAHDHVDIVLEDGACLRLTDPRRFGSLHWTTADPERHRLLARLGPEPLDAGFDGEMLYRGARGRRASVKAYLMDSRRVAGLGNIYANEALFLAGVHPARPAGRLSRARWARLAAAVHRVLAEAIAAGGTTLRDFQASDGRPGYFTRRLRVYGRAGEPCPRCGAPIRQARQLQRSTFYCPRCQR